MHTSSSANRTWSDSRSASEYTATVSSPSSRHARITRSAISPRLAMSTFLNIGAGGEAEAGRSVRVTLSGAKGAYVQPCPLRFAQGDSKAELAHQGVRSSAREAAASPVISVNLRSDAKSTPETRSANSLGLVE